MYIYIYIYIYKNTYVSKNIYIYYITNYQRGGVLPRANASLTASSRDRARSQHPANDRPEEVDSCHGNLIKRWYKISDVSASATIERYCIIYCSLDISIIY